MTKLAKEVTSESMDGDTELEKMINAYLTIRFISAQEVPTDECLTEARELIKLFESFLPTYLNKQAIK